MIDATLVDYWIILDKGFDPTKNVLAMLLRTKLKDLCHPRELEAIERGDREMDVANR